MTGTYFESNGRPAPVASIALDQNAQERAWELIERCVSTAPTCRTRIEATV